jgi:hypothetical protein
MAATTRHVIATELEVHATPLDQALVDTRSSYRTTTS